MDNSTMSRLSAGGAARVLPIPGMFMVGRQHEPDVQRHEDEILNRIIELMRANFHLTRVVKLLEEEKREFAARCEELELDAAQLALDKYWLLRQCRAFALQAKTDQLTGLLKAEEFDERVNWWLTGSGFGRKRQKRTGAMVFIDLDDFGRINKIYGHDAGNQVIQRIGWLLRKRSYSYGDPEQSDGIAARFGGDEFGLFLCEVTVDRAERMMAEIHEEFVRYPFRFQRSGSCALIRIRSALEYLARKDGVHVSFTWGVAGTKQGKSAQALRIAADMAMRRRKRRKVVW